MSQDTVKELQLFIKSGWRLLVMETFEEDRALKLLERAAQATDRGLRTWTLASGLSESGRGARSFDAAVEAMLEVSEPVIFAVLDAHKVVNDPLAIRRLRDALPTLLKRRQLVALFAPVLHLPVELEREAGRIQIPLPLADELEPLFRKIVEAAGQGAASERVLALAVNAALGLTSAEATRVFRKAWYQAGVLDDNAVSWIVREKRSLLGRSPALSFHDATENLSDVGGLGELKRWLKERQRVFSEEGRSFGLPTPRGLLLLGVQGCGKSLCAKAVAREWRFPLLRLDLGAAFGSSSETPEAIMREATAIAESIAPAILWIDEIEKGFASSAEDVSAARVFGSFLTWLAEKRKPVFVVATANDIKRLPPELLRKGRFDELFFVDLPSDKEREEILAIHLRRHGRDPKLFRLDEVALECRNFAGAELEQVVASGLHKAFAQNRDLTHNDLINAITETVPLYETYEESIKDLRDWAKHRARPASLDESLFDVFKQEASEARSL